MNDYGFSPSSLFGLALEPGVVPNESDVYNPDAPFSGNTAAAATLSSTWKEEFNTSRSMRRGVTNEKSENYMGANSGLRPIDWFT